MAAGVELLKLKSFVFVRWFDAATKDGWVSRDTALEQTVTEVLSAGWLVRVTGDAVVLSHGVSDDDDHISLTTIPRRMVQDVWVPRSVVKGALRVNRAT